MSLALLETPTPISEASNTYKLFAESDEKFVLAHRYLVWIGDNEDLDFENAAEADARVYDLVQSGLPRESLVIKTYWYICAGSEDDHLIAQRYTHYDEACEAISRAKKRWFNHQMSM
ncbi:hypothetical protein [Paenibacillus eucommiae]|uniref:Uncharacterized protein n=1 Tax=Paenibacillus eucommiae TaxID=1355755 RepID=A0ABS4J5C9_9BACL|nr:hypothetical protein [Paenibacillus eucommiae]MBP1995052.1 hypothetical protein [Paenibacillus eucommiae]